MQFIDDNVIDYAAWARAKKPAEAVYVKPASHWCDEVTKAFHNPNKKVSISMPFMASPDLFGFRPQEVTLWSGVNGHGKSSILSACTLYWANHGERVCIASLEMEPVKQLSRMVRQATGVRVPSPELIRRFHAWTDEAIWLYEKMGTLQSQRIIELGHYIAEELKCTHFIVDSFLHCGIPSDGPGSLTAQKNFMGELCALAKDTGLHIHIVIHPRKRETENKMMDKMDVRGAGELTDMVDNLIVLHKNIAKTDAISNGEASYEQRLEHDFVMAIKKQRHGEWTGQIKLWSDPDSMQFLTINQGEPPKPVVT